MEAAVDSNSGVVSTQQALSTSGEVQTATAEILLASVELWTYLMRRARLQRRDESNLPSSVNSTLHSPAAGSISSAEGNMSLPSAFAQMACSGNGAPSESCVTLPTVGGDERRQSREQRSEWPARRRRQSSQSPQSPRGLNALLSEHHYVEKALQEYQHQAAMAELIHLPVGVFRNAIIAKAKEPTRRSGSAGAPPAAFPAADRWTSGTADKYAEMAKTIVGKYLSGEANGRVVNLRSFAPEFNGPRYVSDIAVVQPQRVVTGATHRRGDHLPNEGSDDGRHDLTPASTLEAGTNSDGRSSMDRRDSDNNSNETPRVTGLVAHIEASSTGGSFPLPSPRSDHSSLVIDKLSFSANSNSAILREDSNSVNTEGVPIVDNSPFDERKKVMYISGSKSNHVIDVEEKVLLRIWANRREARRLHRGFAAVNEAIAALLLPQCFSAPYSVLLKVDEVIISVTWLLPIASEQPIKLTDKSNMISLRRFAERCLDLVLSPTTSLSCENPMEKRKRSMSATGVAGVPHHSTNVEAVYMVEGRDGRYYVVYQDIPDSPDVALQRRNTGLGNQASASGNPILHAVDLHRFPSGVLIDSRRHTTSFDGCARDGLDEGNERDEKVGVKCTTADCVSGASVQFSVSRDLFQISATRLNLAAEQKALQQKRDSVQPGAAAAELADEMLKRNRSVGFQESSDGSEMLKKRKTTGAPTAMVMALSPVMFINTSQFLKGILFRQCSDGTATRRKKRKQSASASEDLTSGLLHALGYASQLTKEETPLALLLYALCGQIAPASIGSFGKKIAKKLANASLLQNEDWEADTYCIMDVSILLAAELMAFRERLEECDAKDDTAGKRRATLDEVRVAVTDVCCVWGTAVSRVVQHIGYCRSFSLFNDVMQRVVLPDHHHSHLCEQGGAALTFPRAMSEEEEVRSKIFGTAEEERKAQFEAREKHPGIAIARGVLLPLTFGIDCRHNDALQYSRNIKYFLYDPSMVIETREEMLAREANTAKMKALSDFLTAKAPTRRKGEESNNGVLIVDRLNLSCWHLCYAPLLLPERLPLLVHVVGLLLDTAEQHSSSATLHTAANGALPRMELKRRTFLLLAKALGIVIASRVTRISVTGTVLSKCIEAARALIVSLNDDLDEDILRTGLKHLSFPDAEVLTTMIADDLKDITSSVLLSSAYKKSQVQALRDLETYLRRTPFTASASRSQSLASSFITSTVDRCPSLPIAPPVELSAEALAALPLPSRQRIERSILRARQQSLVDAEGEGADAKSSDDKPFDSARQPTPSVDGRESTMSLRLPSMASSPSPKAHSKRLFSQVARKVSHAMGIIAGAKVQGRSKSMGAIDAAVVASPTPPTAPRLSIGRGSASPMHTAPHSPMLVGKSATQSSVTYEAEIPRLCSAMSTPMPPDGEPLSILSPLKLPHRSHPPRSQSFQDHSQREEAVISPTLMEEGIEDLPDLRQEREEEGSPLQEIGTLIETEEMHQRRLVEMSELKSFVELESLQEAEIEHLLKEMLASMRRARPAAPEVFSPRTPVKPGPRAPTASHGSPALQDSLNSNHQGSFSLRRQGSSRGLVPVLVGSPLHSPPMEQAAADSQFALSITDSEASHQGVRKTSSVALDLSLRSPPRGETHGLVCSGTLQELSEAECDALILSERLGRRQVEGEWQRYCDHLWILPLPNGSLKSPYRCVIPTTSGASPTSDVTPAAFPEGFIDSPCGGHSIASLPLSVVSSLGGGGSLLSSDVVVVEMEVPVDEASARRHLEQDEVATYHRILDEFRKRMSQVALKVAMNSMLPSLRQSWSARQLLDCNAPGINGSQRRTAPSVGKAFLPLLPKM